MKHGWNKRKLKDFFKLKYGKGLPREHRISSGQYYVYGSNGIVGKHDSAFTNAPTLIIGRKGSVGEVHICNDSCWPIDTTYYIDEFPDGFPPKYWMLYLKSLRLGQHEKSSAIPGINRNDIYNIDIPVPPVHEQVAILSTLEKLLIKVENCHKRLEKIPYVLKLFRQSVLAAACSGQLTADWRDGNSHIDKSDISVLSVHEKRGLLHKENSKFVSKIKVKTSCLEEHRYSIPKWAENIPTSWCIVALGQIVEEGPKNGLYKPQSFYGEGTIIVRIEDFYDGTIHPWDTLKRLAITEEELQLYGLKSNDILINRVNSIKYLGKSALVRGLNSPSVFESNMMRLHLLKECTDPGYIILFLQSIHGLEELRKNAKHAVNQSSINQQDVKSCVIPLPPLEEQKEIVRRVENLFIIANRIEKRYQEIRKYVDTLTQSILAKAFRGELVP